MDTALPLHAIVEAVANVAAGKQEYLFMPDLSAGTDIPNRDLVRLCFGEAGIDIEFSGRGINEKGVIIDVDDDRLNQLGLGTDHIRFGQTVVRVNPDLRLTGTESITTDDMETQVAAIMTNALKIAKAQ
jgi:GDP-D-mannose dehydratase